MPSLVVDTHSIIWYLRLSDQLSRKAHQAIKEAIHSNGNIFISAISLVEMAYLVEKKRVLQEDIDSLERVLEEKGACFRLCSVDGGIAKALRSVPRDKISDMPDRIIAATALYLKLPLVSKDNRIRLSEVQTIW